MGPISLESTVISSDTDIDIDIVHGTNDIVRKDSGIDTNESVRISNESVDITISISGESQPSRQRGRVGYHKPLDQKD